MKKIYESPKAYVEMFTPNEYVAACGDSGKVYKFVCDAKKGTLYYYSNSDGTIDGNYTGSGKAIKLGSYNPCGETHEASSTSGFYDGFVDRDRYVGNWPFGRWEGPNGKCDSGEEVIVWRGPDGDNGHATKNLDMNSWETAKS